MELDERSASPPRGEAEEVTCVRVILFDDMRGSTVPKERFAEESDEEAFHAVRREDDELVYGVIERDGGGHVIKSTGDRSTPTRSAGSRRSASPGRRTASTR